MTLAARYLTPGELEAGVEEIRKSPADGGVLEMIVRRPEIGEREMLQEGYLDPVEGLVGDNWVVRARVGGHTPNPDLQLTLMNARVAALVAQDKNRWQLAGDQLYVDLDLSEENLPPGTCLAIGSAVVEVAAKAHTGCAKFVERFGNDAMNFVNSNAGKPLRLRGMYVRVVRLGPIRVGDRVTKLSPSDQA
jgi:MOSC domain-containing protein YiiM